MFFDLVGPVTALSERFVLSRGLRARRLWFGLRHGLDKVAGRRTRIHVDDRVDQYRDYWQAAVSEIGADWTALTDRIWEVSAGNRKTRINNHQVPLDDPVTLNLAGDKVYCYQVAKAAGISVPSPRVFRLSELAKATRIPSERPDLYVVKPARGTGAGMGVTTCIQTARALEDAALVASLYCDEFIVERMIPGETCRLLFLGGRCIHAVRRRGLRVTGDGSRPLGQLIVEARTSLSDPVTRKFLEAQGLTADSVLGAGVEAVVHLMPRQANSTHELRTVYDENITNAVCSDLVDELGTVVRAIETEFAAVDFITNDVTVPLRDSGGAFLELNTTPGLHHHYLSDDDQRGKDVAVRILRYLLGDLAASDVATAAHVDDDLRAVWSTAP